MAYRDPEDQKRACREHYQANSETYKARAKKNRKSGKIRVRELARAAKAVPCADCGIQYPYYVMQFDHLGEKLFTIGRITSRGISVPQLLAEIAKCDVVCANCHAERTHSRGQHMSVKAKPPAAPAERLATLFDLLIQEPPEVS